MTERQFERLKDKLAKLAYELEYDAQRCREAGKDSFAGSLRDISSRLGNLGRS